MTRYAVFQGRIVTPEEFDALAGADYRDKRLFPLCPVCDARLSVYGVRSLAVTARFDHPDFSDCPLSSTPNPRFAHLRPGGWDLEAGKRLKAEFRAPENLKQGYAVCRALCLDRLSGEAFIRFCSAADRHRLWAYAGLPLWAVPYLLVTLVDLVPDEEAKRPLRKKHELRFVLQKPKQADIDAAWLSPEQCRLVCVFADSGMPVNSVEPVPLGATSIEAARGDTAWISDRLYAILRKCGLPHAETSSRRGSAEP